MKNVGDEVWYVPEGMNLAVKCKITEVDDQFRKIDPNAFVFYSLDEPIGYELYEDELYNSAEEALKDFDVMEDPIAITLNEYRKRIIDFIVNTWWNLTEVEKEEQKKVWYSELPTKVLGVDWLPLVKEEPEVLGYNKED